MSAAPKLVLPQLLAGPRVKVANINYAVPLSRLQKLREGFGDTSLTYRDIGLSSFDFAYDQLVDESDD